MEPYIWVYRNENCRLLTESGMDPDEYVDADAPTDEEVLAACLRRDPRLSEGYFLTRVDTRYSQYDRAFMPTDYGWDVWEPCGFICGHTGEGE